MTGGFDDNLDDDLWGWKELVDVEKPDWQLVNNWWGDTRRWTPDYQPSFAALLEFIQSTVPMVTIENGMERENRHLNPRDPPNLWEGREHLREPAQILAMGELAALVAGKPDRASTTWPKHRKMIEGLLREFCSQPDPTTGDPAMSRRAHAEHALLLFRSIDFSEHLATQGMDDTDSQAWLREIVCEVAFAAFEAGRRTQVAWGKELEPFMSAGEKVVKGRQLGAEMRKGRTEPETAKRLSEMQRLIDDAKSIRNAAKICAAKNLGPSVDANVELWNKYKKRGHV